MKNTNVRFNYYIVSGKNRYVPKFFYTKAESVADAKLNFYIHSGDNINYVSRITKKKYDENN